jgi:uncharacterized protein (TIGR03435 family)
MTMRTGVRSLILASLLAVARAQEPRLVFETASVKLADPGPPYGGYRHQITPGGIVMRKVSLGYCLRTAWGLKYAYDLAGPGWLDPPTDVLVDLTAKTAAPATPEEVLLMLRNLLIDRFHLTAHMETRDLRTYSLVKIRTEPALKRSEGEGEPKMKPGSKPRSQAFQDFSMALLARYLGPPVTSRPVVDKTGLAGAFDFELDLAPYILDAEGKQIMDHRGAIDSEGANMQALRDQLGLALKSDHAPFPVLVVDQMEKTPTGN